MLEPMFYRTSGGSELIKSGPGMLCGYILTSGSPLGGAVSDCTIAYYDTAVGAAEFTTGRILAQGRATGSNQPATITWTPSSFHSFARGLWLEVVSGSPVVTTTYF